MLLPVIDFTSRANVSVLLMVVFTLQRNGTYRKRRFTNAVTVVLNGNETYRYHRDRIEPPDFAAVSLTAVLLLWVSAARGLKLPSSVSDTVTAAPTACVKRC